MSSSERREQREERREKREEKREKRDGAVPEGRDGGEKGRPLGERREERREKREERDKHNQDERAAEGNSSVPEWRGTGSSGLAAGGMAGGEGRRDKGEVGSEK